jgi:hypothetical protein
VVGLAALNCCQGCFWPFLRKFISRLSVVRSLLYLGCPYTMSSVPLAPLKRRRSTSPDFLNNGAKAQQPEMKKLKTIQHPRHRLVRLLRRQTIAAARKNRRTLSLSAAVAGSSPPPPLKRRRSTSPDVINSGARAPLKKLKTTQKQLHRAGGRPQLARLLRKQKQLNVVEGKNSLYCWTFLLLTLSSTQQTFWASPWHLFLWLAANFLL